jgi:hypothetical protein
MESPPFQFELKAVFGAMAAAAFFAFLAVPGDEAAQHVAALAVLGAWAVIAVVFLGGLAAFVLSASMAVYHSIRLCCRLGRKFGLSGLHRSESAQNPVVPMRGDEIG